MDRIHLYAGLPRGVPESEFAIPACVILAISCVVSIGQGHGELSNKVALQAMASQTQLSGIPEPLTGCNNQPIGR